MGVHKFGAVSISALGGGRPVPARSRNARPGNAVRHLVITYPDRGAQGNALCGYRPKGPRGADPRDQWVLEPSWPEKDCPKCQALKDK